MSYLQTQEQIYPELEKIYEIFTTTMELLENYIEKAGWYSDWEKRKQFKKVVKVKTKQDIIPNHPQQETRELKKEKSQRLEKKEVAKPTDGLENSEKRFLTSLLLLSNELRDKSNIFREKLKQEFDKWIKTTGIDTNNCPPELKHFLFEFNEVLEKNFIEEELKITSLFKDITNNPQNWRLDEIPTEISGFGKIKKQEFVLIHHNACENDFDSEGKLNFNNNPIYRWEIFDTRQRFEVKKALNISVDCLTEEEKVFYHSEQKHLASLIKQKKETKDKIPGTIEEVTRFKTWWSNYNVATVVNYHEGYYRVFLVVYEPEKKDGNKVVISESLQVFPKDKNCNCWGIYKREKFQELKDAQWEAQWLREKLNGENPILLVHHQSNKYTSFAYDIIWESDGYVKKYDVGSSNVDEGWFTNKARFTTPNNLDDYIKPLDIIRVEKLSTVWGKNTRYFHAGVYLGDRKVCHLYDYWKTKGMKARIDDISTFLGDAKGTKRIGHIRVIHPVIPFRDWKKAIRNAVWADNKEYWKGRYCLANRNCEHFSNMLVLGVNYSQQVAERPTKSRIACKFIGSACFSNGGCGNFKSNNGKGSKVCLRNETSEVNDKLGWKINDQSRKIEARIEIPPKHPCQIM